MNVTPPPKESEANESPTTFRCDRCGRPAIFTWPVDHQKTWLCGAPTQPGDNCDGHMRYLAEKTTVIDRGRLTDSPDGYDNIERLNRGLDVCIKFYLAHLLPDEARKGGEGRFEITVKFTPAESEVAK